MKCQSLQHASPRQEALNRCNTKPSAATLCRPHRHRGSRHSHQRFLGACLGHQQPPWPRCRPHPVVYADLAATKPGSLEHREWMEQLDSLRLRGRMLLTALRLFYAALGLFAATALVSVAGSMAAYYGQKVLFEGAGAFSVLAGAAAVASLTFGCMVMVQKTPLAM